MRDFFRPFQRKVGVLVLLVACLLTAGWVRSEFASDIVMYDLNINDDQWGALKSYGQRLYWNHIFGDPDNLKESAGFQCLSYPIQAKEKGLTNDICRIEWMGFEFRFFPCLYGSFQPPFETSVAVPYWSIVLPLTLLSAYLFLSKLRPQPKQPVPHA